MKKVLFIGFFLFVMGVGNYCYRKILTPKISFLDIGQGDSILINDRTVQLLVDAGRNDEKSVRQISSRMLPWDKTIELAIVTHPDLDHIGGFWYILNYFTITTLLVIETEHSTEISRDILEKARLKGTRILTVNQGDTFTIGNSWHATLLWPNTLASESMEDINDHSIVFRLDSKKFSTLLTGDASKIVEQTLEQEIPEALLDVDILKLGHHGSKTSSSENFLRATSPKIAIISAGCDNTYGHPHTEIIERLHFLHLPFLNTCSSGTITYRL